MLPWGGGQADSAPPCLPPPTCGWHPHYIPILSSLLGHRWTVSRGRRDRVLAVSESQMPRIMPFTSQQVLSKHWRLKAELLHSSYPSSPTFAEPPICPLIGSDSPAGAPDTQPLHQPPPAQMPTLTRAQRAPEYLFPLGPHSPSLCLQRPLLLLACQNATHPSRPNSNAIFFMKHPTWDVASCC